jgi:hypothetical protein
MAEKPHKQASLHFEPEHVLDIFGAARNVLGAELADVAVRSPHTAYEFLRGAIFMITDREANVGPKTRDSLEALMPLPVVETTDVTISAIDMPDGPGPEHRTLDRGSSVILSFTVEPLTEL